MIRPELVSEVPAETADALLAGLNRQEWADGAPWIGAQRGTLFRVHPDGVHDAVLVTPGHLIGPVGFDPSVVTAHWLLDAATLHIIGEITYPVDVGWVAALGDGTWLTDGEDRLYRWRMPATVRS